MSLSTFCDLVWAEIWDDCPPMGDQNLYRELMIRLIINGEDPEKITWVDSDGKTQRLSSGPARKGGRPAAAEFDRLAELQERIKNIKAAAVEGVASSGDG